jgi:hypothetical protein
VCEFSYTYDETAPGGRVALESIPFWDAYSAEDDPLVMFREFPDAIRFADSIVPNLFDNTFRVVLFIDRAKRGRSSLGYLNPPVLTSDGRAILVSTSIQDSTDMVDADLKPSNMN